MKKTVHDSNARRNTLTRFVSEHVADVCRLICQPDLRVDFNISDVKRDGNVRIKFKTTDDAYQPVTLVTGLHFRGVKTATYDDVYAYVPLADVPLDLKW